MVYLLHLEYFDFFSRFIACSFSSFCGLALVIAKSCVAALIGGLFSMVVLVLHGMTSASISWRNLLFGNGEKNLAGLGNCLWKRKFPLLNTNNSFQNGQYNWNMKLYVRVNSLVFFIWCFVDGIRQNNCRIS